MLKMVLITGFYLQNIPATALTFQLRLSYTNTSIKSLTFSAVIHFGAYKYTEQGCQGYIHWPVWDVAVVFKVWPPSAGSGFSIWKLLLKFGSAECHATPLIKNQHLFWQWLSSTNSLVQQTVAGGWPRYMTPYVVIRPNCVKYRQYNLIEQKFVPYISFRI